MFRRSESNLPEDPKFPADLAALGFKLNEQGQFVKVSNESEFFNFFASDNERSNEKRKEVMHVCAREAVRQAAAEHGVVEVYLCGKDGKDISMTKPNGPHLRIFVTDLEVLKQKKDVVVVVGEHNQDVGIWACRSLMREGGIDGGSVVGLVKKLEGE